MRRAWASFAHTGTPGWPTFNLTEQVCCAHPPDPSRRPCRFDLDTTITHYPEQASASVWDWNDFAALEPAGGKR